MTAQRPPWVLVVTLPGDCPPIQAQERGFAVPRGSHVVAFCNELAEDVLAASSEAIERDRARVGGKSAAVEYDMPLTGGSTPNPTGATDANAKSDASS